MVPAILQSLPSPLSLEAAASYELTVAPYFEALKAYPNALLEALQSKAPLSALSMLYATTNPLITSTAIAIGLIPIFFITSEVNRNWSQVDRVWSILPVVLNGQYALWRQVSQASSGGISRVELAAMVLVVWGTRLTFNYWRRGGYQIGSEDYRWQIVQKKTGPVLFFLFNVFFISSAQSILLLMISFPSYVLLLSEKVTGQGLTPVDLGFAAWILFLVGLTATADQQQWNFHNAKHAYQKSAKAQTGYNSADLDLGFNTVGLWRYSRHPNFLAEQGVWLSLYAWSCVITKTPYNWSGVGALGYLILFQSSTFFTEWISAGKYPAYKDYQKSTGMFLPLPGKGWSPVEKSQQAVKKAGSKKRQ